MNLMERMEKKSSSENKEKTEEVNLDTLGLWP